MFTSMEHLKQNLEKEKQGRKAAMPLRAGLIRWHQSVVTSPHPHEDPLLHTERVNSSLSYAEILFNARLLSRNLAAGDGPLDDIIRQMKQDNRAISYISGQIQQLEDTLGLLRPPSTSAKSACCPNSSA